MSQTFSGPTTKRWIGRARRAMPIVLKVLGAIAGLIPPSSGAVYCNSKPTLLGINAALVPNLTGERNVVLGCLAMGMEPDEVEDKYESIVEFSGIGDFINLPMKAYSSGMAARLRCLKLVAATICRS